MKTPAFLIRLSILLPMLVVLPQTQAKTFPAGADNFADAPEIDVRSGMSEPTDISGFSLEAGERPDEPWESSRKTAWWSWTAPSSGFCTADSFHVPGVEWIGQRYITVWQGDSVETMKPAIMRNGTTGARLQKKNRLAGMSFHAVKGETYKIAVDLGMNGWYDFYPIRLRLILTPSKRMYTGLWRLTDGDGSTVDLGQVTLSEANSRRFTGKITMRAGSRGFTGQFDEAGLATVTLHRLAPGAGATTLRLDVSGSGAFSLERNSMVAAGKLAERALFSPYFPYPFDRRFTCIFAPDENGRTGAGMLNLAVTKTGVVQGVGTGLDGTAFTFASRLMMTEAASDLGAPFHVRLGGRRGAVQITLGGFITDEWPLPRATGHFFRAQLLHGEFYPTGIDVAVDGTGFPLLGRSSGVVVSPIHSGLLSDTNGDGVLVVHDAEDGFAHGPVNLPLTLEEGRVGRITFASNELKPVLKGTWKTDMARGSLLDLTGRRCPVIVIRNSTGPYSHKMVGLVRGRTRTYRVEVRPPDVAP